ncbi:hypothetical protein [Kitasatospora viridis]|uniref:Uncharacterized protein n=1 Tax=Kitasatospora viridis TaxID=281105 RepID=A0A561S9Z4_9ACTN|nr:hypothetical protein [Kitasatospora viridis]TWF71690.1 hypothetical protein FHX73_1861 [Kitasatospora viridis]
MIHPPLAVGDRIHHAPQQGLLGLCTTVTAIDHAQAHVTVQADDGRTSTVRWPNAPEALAMFRDYRMLDLETLAYCCPAPTAAAPTPQEPGRFGPRKKAAWACYRKMLRRMVALLHGGVGQFRERRTG